MTRAIVRQDTRQWIDATVPIRDGMLKWPDNPPVELTRHMDMAGGDPATVSRLALGVHSGTHVDAPVHFRPGADGVDALALDSLIGPARVVPIGDVRAIGVEELRSFQPQEGERLLFKTRNSATTWIDEEFAEDFVYLSFDAARFLVEGRVRTVGIDYLSIAGMDEGAPTHQALLDAGVCIIEGLDLSAAAPGAYEMICLPLRLAGADGAPARVILRSQSGEADVTGERPSSL